MNCPKCKGRMVYDPPLFEGDQGSGRCLICGARIWEPPKVVMPDVPSVGPGLARKCAKGDAAVNIHKARETKLQRLEEKKTMLAELADASGGFLNFTA